MTWAQHGEDDTIARLLNWNGSDPLFYIDVGALDPEFCSVTKIFYDAGGWGINIEPQRLYYEKLLAARPRDLNFCCGIGNPGQGVLMPFTDFRSDQAGFSTFSEKWSQVWGGPREVVPTPVYTLEEVCRDHVGDRVIDFLKVDAEEWEDRVVAGGNWEKWRPRVAVLECFEPCSSVPTYDRFEPTLFAAGYELVHEDPGNRYYMPKER